MKKILFVLKIIAITICIILSLSFLITMSRNIVNMGNVIGLVVCLIVIFSLLFYNKYKNIKPLRLCTKVFAMLMAVGCIYCSIVSTFMISGMMNTPEKALQTGTDGAAAEETVIVLGCKTINGHPSMMLAARLETAAEYLAENPQAVCIVSGGKGSDEIESEAATMERFLITKGISKDRIYKEENSRNTEQNLLYSKSVIDEHNLSENVVIVSEQYHVYRGMRNAKKQGLVPSALPAPMNRTIWAIPSYWLREIIAITRDYVFDLLNI